MKTKLFKLSLIFAFGFFILVSKEAKANAIDTLLPWPSTFEQRREQFIQDVMNNIHGETLDSGGLEPCQRNLLWGYLEDKSSPTQLEKDIIHVTLKAMVLGWRGIYGQEPQLMQELRCNALAGYEDDGTYVGYGDSTVGFGYSVWIDNVLVPKLLIRYKGLVGSKISETDYNLLKSEMQKSIDNQSVFIAANGNQQINVMTGAYLYAKNFAPQATVYYPHPCANYEEGTPERTNCERDLRWEEFDYNGHSYKFENSYNLLQFSRDWLELMLDKFVNTKDYSDKYTRMAYYFEFDGNYIHSYLDALRILADFADEPLIKKKADMVFDLMLLDFYMDFNGVLDGSHGGVEGRSGADEAYSYILFGFQKGMHSVYPEHNFYTTSYRMPRVIRDAIVLMDEPADYWHINMEYNPQLNSWQVPGGKYTYVTKNEVVDGAETAGVWDKLQLVYPGVSSPFDRLETVDWQGNKMIDWNNNVMTVSRHGYSCVYNFNTWTTSGNGCVSDETSQPSLTPTLSGLQGDLDKDGDVDIFDYNLLADNFGVTTCGNIADIDVNCKIDIFDYNILVENFGQQGVQF